MPLFSLSAAHANDRAGKDEFVLVNAALMLFYSFGAIGGPLVASSFMQRFGPQRALRLHAPRSMSIFILIILYRMRARASVPASRARPLHRAAAHLDDLRPAGAQNGGADKPQDARLTPAA